MNSDIVLKLSGVRLAVELSVGRKGGDFDKFIQNSGNYHKIFIVLRINTVYCVIVHIIYLCKESENPDTHAIFVSNFHSFHKSAHLFHTKGTSDQSEKFGLNWRGVAWRG